MAFLSRVVFLVALALACAQAQAYEKCSLGRCFSNLSEDEQKQVMSGSTLLKTGADSAGFEQLYGYKLIRNVTPELAAGVFTDFPAHANEIKAVRRSKVLEKAPGRVSVEYEYKVGDIIGGIAKVAPASEYVLVENVYREESSGRFWVEWLIDAPRTSQFYRGFSVTGHIAQPEYIHGFFAIEPVTGTNDVIVTSANFIVPKNDKAKKAARDADGLVAEGAREAHVKTLEQFARWIERVNAQSDDVKASYVAKLKAIQPMCAVYLSR